MGLFSTKSSSTTSNYQETNQFDKRVAATDNAFVAQNSTLIDNRVANTIDPGAVALAQDVSRTAGQLAYATTEAADRQLQKSLGFADSTVDRSLDIVQRALQQSAAAAADAFGFAAEAQDEAARLTGDTVRAGFTFGREAMDEANWLAGKALDAVSFGLQEVSNEAGETRQWARDFVGEFYQSQQTEAERNFDRISSLATVAVLVLGAGYILWKVR